MIQWCWLSTVVMSTSKACWPHSSDPGTSYPRHEERSDISHARSTWNLTTASKQLLLMHRVYQKHFDMISKHDIQCQDWSSAVHYKQRGFFLTRCTVRGTFGLSTIEVCDHRSNIMQRSATITLLALPTITSDGSGKLPVVFRDHSATKERPSLGAHWLKMQFVGTNMFVYFTMFLPAKLLQLVLQWCLGHTQLCHLIVWNVVRWWRACRAVWLNFFSITSGQDVGSRTFLQTCTNLDTRRTISLRASGYHDILIVLRQHVSFVTSVCGWWKHVRTRRVR